MLETNVPEATEKLQQLVDGSRIGGAYNGHPAEYSAVVQRVRDRVRKKPPKRSMGSARPRRPRRPAVSPAASACAEPRMSPTIATAWCARVYRKTEGDTCALSRVNRRPRSEALHPGGRYAPG